MRLSCATTQPLNQHIWESLEEFCAFLFYSLAFSGSTASCNKYLTPYSLHPVLRLASSINPSCSTLKTSLQRGAFLKVRMENLTTLDPQLFRTPFPEAQPQSDSVFPRQRQKPQLKRGNNKFGSKGKPRCASCRKWKRKVWCSGEFMYLLLPSVSMMRPLGSVLIVDREAWRIARY